MRSCQQVLPMHTWWMLVIDLWSGGLIDIFFLWIGDHIFVNFKTIPQISQINCIIQKEAQDGYWSSSNIGGGVSLSWSLTNMVSVKVQWVLLLYCHVLDLIPPLQYPSVSPQFSCEFILFWSWSSWCKNCQYTLSPQSVWVSFQTMSIFLEWDTARIMALNSRLQGYLFRPLPGNHSLGNWLGG